MHGEVCICGIMVCIGVSVNARPELVHSVNVCWYERVEKEEANELRFLHPKFKVYFDLGE